MLHLMVFVCQIPPYIVLWLAAWCTLQLLDQILLMMSMLLVSLLSFLLQCIGQSFFAYVFIFGEPSFRAFSFPHHPHWNYVLILMMIGLTTPEIVSRPHGFVSFLVTFLYLGRVRSNIMFLVLLQKLSIVIWHPSLLK